MTTFCLPEFPLHLLPAEVLVVKRLLPEATGMFIEARMPEELRNKDQVAIIGEGLYTVLSDALHLALTPEWFLRGQAKPLPTIDDLELTVRTVQVLKHAGIDTIQKLVAAYQAKELSEVPNFGKKCMMDVRDVLTVEKLI